MSRPVNSVDGLATQFMVTHILSFVPYSIVYYDYFLTLSDEVELFWLHPGKFNLFSYLFLFNRYLSIFGNLQILIFGIIGRFDFMSCRTSHIYHMVLLLVQQTFIAILCIMQIHAIYRSKRVLVFLTLIAVAGVAIPCWCMYTLSSKHLSYPAVITPVLGCTRALRHMFLDSAISWTGGLVVDTTVFVLLLCKTVSVGRGVRLLDTMMRNGTSPPTLFFATLILSLVNLSNILILRVCLRFLE
ncbi:hypothetical protein H4582DRAFT_1942657 [Lactarius indigo]|nr:hypothetical protein H4582DRAFT_1942657 [Lactarius indigo]